MKYLLLLLLLVSCGDRKPEMTYAYFYCDSYHYYATKQTSAQIALATQNRKAEIEADFQDIQKRAEMWRRSNKKREMKFTARATVYWPVSNQTDSTPLITADGSVISIEALEQGKIQWCALSRDLLTRWGGPFEYGDKLRVTGCGAYDGIWTVHDTMNARFGKTAPTHDRGVPGVVRAHDLKPVEVDGKYHIDFLVKQGELEAWNQIQIQKL